MYVQFRIVAAFSICWCVVFTSTQSSAAIITYSGTGHLHVHSGGAVHDPAGFGVTAYPGLPVEFTVKVNDNPEIVRPLIPGNRIGGITSFDGNVTVNGVTSSFTHMAILIYDNFRSGGNFGNPAYDQLTFLFSAEFNFTTFGFNYIYNLPPDTFSFSGSSTPPPIFSTTAVSGYNEPGRSREDHRYRFITSPPPGPSSLIPDGHTLSATTANAVPEPSSCVLLGLASVAMSMITRRRNRRVPLSN